MSEAIWEHSLSNSRNTLRVLGGLVDGMAKLPGERMILLASTGFLTGNLEVAQDRLMAKALYVVNPTGDASAPAGWVLPSERGVETKNAELDSQAMAADAISDLPVRFTWEQWAGPPGITMVAHLDLDHLHFETRQGRRTQKLTLVGALLDSRGGFVTGKRLGEATRCAG
jgi:hypothetical protein